ncbi:MAG: tyrosine-type recombinase/integrase [Planctomycetota bacterium]|jgi:integrase
MAKVKSVSQRGRSKIPGTIYLNKNRWWWKVKLPGEDKPIARPLRPIGSKYATTDRSVADEVARQMWDRAVFQSERPAKDVHTAAELVQAYLEYAKDYYRRPDGKTTREPENIRYAVVLLVEHCPTLPAEEFGPLKLKYVRELMIKRGWCRGVINQRIGIIKRMFKWAASEQLVPASTYHGLQTVEGLKRGRSGAKETEPVKPVAESHVRAVLPFTSTTVAAMIELQLLTGMRSGELVIMRPCDIETTGKIWRYQPKAHKTKYRGDERIISIGPKAQKILKPFLKRKLTDYCFSPVESDSERNQKKRVKLKRKAGVSRSVGERYDSASYRRAVEYAIKAARKAGLKVPDFHPHQLRHTAATRIRKEMGLDAARAMLGHRNLKITDDYAELDQALAGKAALKFG